MSGVQSESMRVHVAVAFFFLFLVCEHYICDIAGCCCCNINSCDGPKNPCLYAFDDFVWFLIRSNTVNNAFGKKICKRSQTLCIFFGIDIALAKQHKINVRLAMFAFPFSFTRFYLVRSHFSLNFRCFFYFYLTTQYCTIDYYTYRVQSSIHYYFHFIILNKWMNEWNVLRFVYKISTISFDSVICLLGKLRNLVFVNILLCCCFTKFIYFFFFVQLILFWAKEIIQTKKKTTNATCDGNIWFYVSNKNVKVSNYYLRFFIFFLYLFLSLSKFFFGRV